MSLDPRSLDFTKPSRVVVVGAGYVGLPLAVEIAKKHKVSVLESDLSKVENLTVGRSYIPGVTALDLKGFVHIAAEPHFVRQAEAVIICVPTPLNKTRDPDNSFILQALDSIIPHLARPCLIVLESTTFPGFTREVMVPRLAQAGLVLDKDVFVAFSPERVDPGNQKYNIKNTPKIVGGATAASLVHAQQLYSSFVDKVVPVSSTDTAETVKLLENTFRAVNIGFVNELAVMCHRLDVNVWEVIEAAKTKPFGFMPFYPGPGVGGHCIKPDPLYLAWKLKMLDYTPRFISLADSVNSEMPAYVVSRVAEALNEHKLPLNGAEVLVCGVAYKADVSDVRESPALEVIALLQKAHADVSYYDPHVPEAAGLKSIRDPFGAFDCIVITTAHTAVDYSRLVEARVVVDCRNVVAGSNVVRL